MIEQIDKGTVIDKAKELLQRANKWWDSSSTDKVNNAGILTVGSLLGLIFISKISLVVIVIILGGQRIMYQGKFFTEDGDTSEDANEDITDKR